LVYDFPGIGDGVVYISGALNPDQEDAEAEQGSGTEPGPPGISALWFYSSANKDRYAAFAARMPELDMPDVVWMVEANLDMQPYSGLEPAVDPESLTVLVNKFFYLEEDFSPPGLVEIDSCMLRSEAAEAMEELINVAAVGGFRLWIQSGYRSYTVQKTIYENYIESDGQENADTFSARPGHSEHQTGLSADFNTITDAFGESPEGHWVAENSWQFGYIMRYTKENAEITHFRPEPWHFRYIGKERAAHFNELKLLSYE
jgi:D-alanyl-D-alanine carboxypeptidase